MALLTLLKYALVAISVALVIVVVLQSQQGGLGPVLGGSSGGESYRSKRGLEGFLYNATIVLGILFGICALAIAILSV
jgi:protein translocase SecG subunit